MFLLTNPAIAAASTSVGGAISVDTTWEASGNPYVVSANDRTDIQSSATLTIDPGVVVQFEPGAAMDVHGVINAQGTSGQPIVFEPTGTVTENPSWGRVQLLNHSATSTFAHVNWYGGELFSGTSDFDITNSRFWFTHEIQVAYSSGDPPHSWSSNFSNNHIFDGSVGFSLGPTPAGEITIADNVIGYCPGCQGIEVPGDLGSLILNISGNLVENVDNAIAVAGLGSPTVTMNDNSVVGNTGSGFTINSVSAPGTVSMSGNNDFENLSHCGGCGSLVYKAGAGNVDAEGNWWGTTVQSEIESGITDANDGSGSGVVDFMPFLSGLSSSAPTPDTVKPETTLGSTPAAITASSSAAFGGFGTSKSGTFSSFECRLDAEVWTWCPSAASYTGLGDGPHSFEVRAFDVAGNLDPTPATFAFTVDSTAPTPSLTSPATGSTTNDTTPTFSGSAGVLSGDMSSVTIRIYQGSNTTGSPVQTLPAVVSEGAFSIPASAALVPDGQYTAQVEQDDAAGNEGLSSPVTFTVDSTAPTPSLTSPATGSTTNDTTPTFSGSAGVLSGDMSSVTIRIYQGSNTTGSPVQTLPAVVSEGAFSIPASAALVPDGQYTAQVEQDDAAGNEGLSSPVTFTVDSTAPTPSLTSPATGSTTNDTTPTFSGSAGVLSGDMSSVTIRIYQGSNTTGSPVQTLPAVVSEGAFSIPASAALVPDGQYTAQVEQDDAAGNEGLSSPVTFTVDSTAPSTTITAQPPTSTTEGIAIFTFSSSEENSTYECQLDGAGITPCPSPRIYQGLPAGTHNFKVWAIDSVGNKDPAGSAVAWTIVQQNNPPTTKLSSSTIKQKTGTVSFSFSSSGGSSGYQCALFRGRRHPNFKSCRSPKTYKHLKAGNYTFEVRAVGPAGPDPSPAKKKFTLQELGGAS